MLHQLKSNISWCLTIRLTKAGHDWTSIDFKIVNNFINSWKNMYFIDAFLGFLRIVLLKMRFTFKWNNLFISTQFFWWCDLRKLFLKMIYKWVQFIKLIFTIWWSLQIVIAVEINFYEFKLIYCHYLGNFFKIKFTVPI